MQLGSKQDQTADKVLSALLYLSQSPTALSVRDIAHGIGKPLSTTYRYLNVLREWELVSENLEGSGYLLGPRCLTLASMFGQHFELGRVALPTLQTLVDRTGETALLMIPVSGQVLCVAGVESPQPLRYAVHKDAALRSPLRGAGSTAMLPYLSRAHWEAALAREPHLLESELAEERRRVLAQGYALSDSSDEMGVLCVGAPILRHTASKVSVLIGSVSVAAPAFRLDGAMRETLIREVRDAAARLNALVAGGPA